MSYRYHTDIATIMYSIKDGKFSGDVNTMTNHTGKYPVLHTFFMVGRMEYDDLLRMVLPYLKDVGADLTTTDSDGLTPIDWLWKTSHHFKEDYDLVKKHMGDDIPEPQRHVQDYNGREYCPGECTKCDFKCLSSKRLQEHYRWQHDSITCAKCSEVVNGLNSLDDHARSAHGLGYRECMQYTCKYCGDTFTGNTALLDHKKSQHRFHCRY